MEKIYRIGDLRKVVKESANEFKPVVGNKDNKEINGEAYDSIKKATKDYDGGMTKGNNPKSVTPDMNQGMSDIRYDAMPKGFGEKVQSQLKGYVSSDAEKLHKDDPFGNATFKEIEGLEQHAKDSKEIKDDIKLQGLTGRTQSKKDVEKDNTTVFESKKIDKLNFKNTKFISENHMLSKVPDHYKFEGSRFMMNDSDGTSYLVEWHINDKPFIKKELSKKLVNEEFDRIKSLFNYNPKNANRLSTNSSRINENEGFANMMGKARNLG